MKRVLSIAILAGFTLTMATSCIKNCDCKEYDSAGKVSSEYSLPKVNGSGWKCKDYNETYSDGSKLECK